MKDDEPKKLPASREEARALGLPQYYTGKPCKHGHRATRRTSNACCAECDRGHGRNYMRKVLASHKALKAITATMAALEVPKQEPEAAPEAPSSVTPPAKTPNTTAARTHRRFANYD